MGKILRVLIFSSSYIAYHRVYSEHQRHFDSEAQPCIEKYITHTFATSLCNLVSPFGRLQGAEWDIMLKRSGSTRWNVHVVANVEIERVRAGWD